MAIILKIFGEPKSQKRHRHTRIGGFVRTYDPSSTDKGDFLSIIQAHAPKTPLTEPLRVEIDLYFTRPKGHYGTGKNSGKLKDNAPIWHTAKPDVDNVFKFITDSMKGVFYKDDSYIVSSSVTKRYDEKPRIEIKIDTI